MANPNDLFLARLEKGEAHVRILLSKKEQAIDDVPIIGESQTPRRLVRKITRPDDGLLKPRTQPPCAWSRMWTFSFDNYRVWSVTIDGTPYTYNGTLYTDRSESPVSFGLTFDTFGIAQGHAGQYFTAGDWQDPVEIEAFDPNALPVEGSWSFDINRTTGANTLVTPIGSFSLTLNYSSPVIDGSWHRWWGVFNFRNFSINVGIWDAASEGSGDPTVTWNSEPHWSHYSGLGPIGISRSGNSFTKTGINLIKGDAQDTEYIVGPYDPPLPSSCNEATADAQGEAYRASFEDELATRYFLRNITDWTPV